MRIPHSLPTLGEEEARGLTEVLLSGRISTGEEVVRFESEMAQYLGLKGGVATSSGTAALHLVLLALGVKEGDEVICPSFTCTALLNAISYCQATPIVVDIDEENMNISLEATKQALTRRTAAIILPHMFGHPVEGMEGFLSLGLPVIEDCAQSLGTIYKGRLTGTWGTAAVLSFYATKVITTGQGGMILSQDEGLLARIRDLRAYDKKKVYKTRYNYCMTDLQGRMGRIQLGKLPSFLKRRQELAQVYQRHLKEIKGITLPPAGGIYYRYVVRLMGKDLKMVIDKLHAEGIEAQPPVFLPLHRNLGLKGFAATEKVFAQALSLPIYPRLTEAEVDYIAGTLHQVMEA